MRAGVVKTASGQDRQSSAARASERTGISRGGLTLPFVFGSEEKVVQANCPSA